MTENIDYYSVFYMGPITHYPPHEISDWVSHKVVITEWINAAPAHKSVLRVRELIGKLHLVQADINAYPDNDAPAASGEDNPSSIPDRAQRILDKQDEVVGTFCEHLVSHAVEHNWDGHLWNLPLVPLPLPGEFILQRECWVKDGEVSTVRVEGVKCIRNFVGEGEVLVRIASLALSGELYRLRECSNPGCTEWFYADRSNKTHHCAACQIKHNASSPVRKQRRNNYHAKIRQEERERRLKMESASRRGPAHKKSAKDSGRE